jgi:DNA-binding transcriptional MerR regulator
MEKSLPAIPAKRYFTIGEVSDLCGVKPYVLRYWEQEFSQLKPMKRRGNRRYYQHHEVLLIRRIRELLYDQGFTISGARNRLSDVPLQPGDDGLAAALAFEADDGGDPDSTGDFGASGPAETERLPSGPVNGATPETGASRALQADALPQVLWGRRATDVIGEDPAPEPSAGVNAMVLTGHPAGGPVTPEQLRAELISIRSLLQV